MPKIRILLVDDHSIVRLGLMTLLNGRADMEVVGECSSAEEALLAVEKQTPDVVLMDVRLPGESGVQATREITRGFPRTKVVILTSYASDSLVFRALQAGAVGYVLKQVATEELVRAIQAAARGDAPLDPSVAMKVITRVREAGRKSDADAFRDLSPRELDVLLRVAQGRTNAEIAAALALSEKTVGHYVSKLLEKLEFSNRIELATYAVENHLADRLRDEE